MYNLVNEMIILKEIFRFKYFIKNLKEISLNMQDNKKILIYESDENKVIADVLVMGESIWMTQKQMANLFDADLSVVSKHLSNIFDEGELSEKATVAKIARVQKEGNREVSRQLNFYNLDAIIALGYRINSKKATKFRIWATSVLKEYLIKGFALDDERLKRGKLFLEKIIFKNYLKEFAR